jgi:LysR family transcriptional regulator, nod-box dependent transcriptional activator
MRYQKLDLNLLSALKVLLERRNVTRAGEILHVSQSAMSGILSRLRDYFEDPLIVQVGRRMELTPLAESLIAPINDILMRIDTALNSRPDFDPASMHGNFVIVTSDYVSAMFLCDVLRRIHHEAPGVSWRFKQPSSQSSNLLDAGDVDFVICPDHYASERQSKVALFDDSYVIAIAEENTNIGDSISLEQYLAAGHVSFQTGNDGMPLFESWFAEQHGRNSRRIEVNANSFHLLPQLIVGTRRIATLHTRMAASYLVNLPIRLVRPEFEMPKLVEVLQWHRHRDIDAGSQWLRERIIALAAEMPSLGYLQDRLAAQVARCEPSPQLRIQ